MFFQTRVEVGAHLRHDQIVLVRSNAPHLTWSGRSLEYATGLPARQQVTYAFARNTKAACGLALRHADIHCFYDALP